MRELSYENQGTNTYLVYEIKDTDVVDSMSLGMLTNNKISGIAQTIFTQMDNNRYIKFNVSAKVSVAQFFMGAVNKKRLLGVFKGMVDAILSAEDYMLDVKNMLLDLDYIFTDVSNCETVLLCLPISYDNNNVYDMRNFFRNIMFSTQFDQTENCDYVAKLINYLNSTSTFSMEDFRELLKTLLNDAGPQSVEKQQVVKQPQVKQVQPDVEVKSVQSVQQSHIVVEQPQVPVQPKVEIPAPQPVVVPVNSVPVQEEKVDVSNSEKQMTMFGLLRNFSKENVALYKAQKAASKPEKTKEKKNKTKGEKTENPGFAIPGQTNGTMPVNVSQKQNQLKPQQQKVEVSNSAPQKATSAPITTGYTGSTAPQTRPMNFGETTVLGSGNFGETTVLSAIQQTAQQFQPFLIRVKNNEKISLNKPVFRIGKEKSYVDYFINDNTAISRSHANVIIRENNYYVMDTNSTNHTYVNGGMIQSNVEVELKSGDKLRLANEEFEFKIESF